MCCLCILFTHLVSVKYNKTLKTLLLLFCMKYTALSESIVTNITLCLFIF